MQNNHSNVNLLAFAALAAGLVLMLSVTPTLAYAQPSFEEVSGKYTKTEAGIEVTFPDGWSGGGWGTSEALQVTVVPGGFTGTEPTKSIFLIMGPHPGNDPIDPTSMVNFFMGDCDAPLIKSRTVSGVQGIVVSADCPAFGSAGRIVYVATEDRLVLVTYRALSSEFAADLANFEATVDSLTVQGAIDSALGSGTSIKTNFVQVATVGEELVDVRFVTSTGVLDFGLDEETRTMSFKVFGDDESTVILVGAVLEDPYVVTIDGEEITDFEETISYPGFNTISVPHGAGEHEIAITGTRVVPEFPVAVLAGTGALIGIVSVIGRTRFVERGISARTA